LRFISASYADPHNNTGSCIILMLIRRKFTQKFGFIRCWQFFLWQSEGSYDWKRSGICGILFSLAPAGGVFATAKGVTEPACRVKADGLLYGNKA
jgi:hypothetical protein